MAVEGARRRELAELVADHVLGHQHGDELLAVIDAISLTDELRQDGRAPRPDLDDLVTAGSAGLLRLLQEIAVDERTFPGGTRHEPVSYFACRRRTMSRSVFLLLRVFLPLVGLPHGVTGWRPPEVRPSPPPCGWSIGFIATPRTEGLRPSQRFRPALPITIFWWSGLETAPIVARHSARTMRISPEAMRRRA